MSAKVERATYKAGFALIIALAVAALAPASAVATYDPPTPGDTYNRNMTAVAVPVPGSGMMVEAFAFGPDGYLWTVENDWVNFMPGTSRLVKRDLLGDPVPGAIYGQGVESDDLSWASAIVVDPVTNDVLVADSDKDCIFKFDGLTGAHEGSLNVVAPNVIDMELDGSRRLYMVDSSSDLQQVIRLQQDWETVDTRFGVTGGAIDDTGFQTPSGIHIDGNNILWVADTGNNRIVKYSLDGTRLLTVNPIQDEQQMLQSPYDVFVDYHGTIYVADRISTGAWQGGRITRWELNGLNQPVLRGEYGVLPGESGLLSYPGKIMVNDAGSILVNDFANSEGTLDWWLLNADPDSVAPVSTYVGPSTWTKGPAQIQLSATDTGTINPRILYSTDGSNPSIPYTGSISIADQGITYLSYQAIDRAGNHEAVQTHEVMVDDGFPWSVSDNQSTYVGQAVIGFTSGDELSGAKHVRFALDGLLQPLSSTQLVSESTSPTVHTLTYWAVDNAGNIEPSHTETFTIMDYHEVPPVTTWPSYQGDWYTTPATVELQARDQVDGIGATYYTLDGSAPTVYTGAFNITKEGTTTIQYWSVDTLGYAELPKTKIVRVDTGDPHSWAVDVPEGAIGSATVTFDASDAVSGVQTLQWHLSDTTTWTTGSSVTIESHGNKTVFFRAIDRAGNVEDEHSIQFTILRPDYDPPVTSSNIPLTGWVRGPYLLAFDPRDDISGVAVTKYSVDSPILGNWVPGTSYIQDGIHDVTWYSVDNRGNQEATQTRTLKVDSRPPTTTTDALPHYAGPTTIHLFWSDNLSTAQTFYSIDGAVAKSGTNIDLNDFRTYEIEYWSEDDAGNVEAHHFMTVVVNPPDVTPPTTTFTGSQGWRSNFATFALTAFDASSTIKGTYYSTNGVQYFPYFSPVNVTAEGAIPVSYYSVDFYNNSEDLQTSYVYVDNTAPVTTSDIVPNYTDQANITLTPTDPYSGVAATYYSINNGVWQTGTSVVVPWSRWRRTHNLRWYSVDALGTTETVKSANFDVRLNSQTYENSDARYVYRGTWDRISKPDCYMTDSAGGYALVAFQGTKLDLYGHTGSYGKMQVTLLNETTPTVVDEYNAWESDNVMLWTTGDLDYGDHLVKVEWLGTKNGSSAETRINIDKVAVEGSLQEVPDTAAPVTTDDAPDEWVHGPVEVSLSSVDGTTGVKAIYATSNGATPTVTNTYTAPFTIAAEGQTTIRYFGADYRGNVESMTSTVVRIDNTAPISSSNAIPSYVGTASIGISRTEPLSGWAYSMWRLDGGTWTTGTAIVVPPTSLGKHTIEYYSVDNVGNTETPKSASFYVLARSEMDDTRFDFQGSWTTTNNASFSNAAAMRTSGPAPATAYLRFKGTAAQLIALKSPAQGIAAVSLDGGAPVDVDLYAGTNQFPSPSVPAVWSAMDLADTTHTVTVSWTGRKNPLSSATTINIDALDIAGAPVADTLAPTSASSALGAWRSAPELVSFTASDTHTFVNATLYRVEGSALTTYLAPFWVAAEGDNDIEYYSVDGAGNVEAPKYANVRIDYTAPTISDNADPDWVNGPVNVIISAADALSGMGSVSYSTDGSDPSLPYGIGVLVSAQGQTTLRYRAQDAVGNTTSIRESVVRIDDVAPVTTHDAPLDWVASDVNVTLTPTDPLSGVSQTRYVLDGVEGTGVGPIAVQGDGVHTLAYASVDAVGNTETTATIEIKIDGSLPWTTDDAPADWVSGPVTVSLTGHDDVSGVDEVLYSIDGTEPSLTYTEPLVFADQGTTTLKFKTVDVRGNEEAVQTRYIRIDDDAPVTSSDAPQGWVPDSVTLTLSATDPVSGVDTIEYRTENGDWTTYTEPLQVVAEGTTHFGVRATDVKGNVSSPVTTSVSIDGSLPWTTDDAPADWVSGPVTVSLTGHDDVSGVDEVLYSIDGTEPSLTYTEPLVFADQGTTTLKFKTVDVRGNEEAVQTRYIRIDDDAPVVSHDVPTDWSHDPVTITLGATDDVSGVSVVEYRIDEGDWTTYQTPVHVDGPGVFAIAVRATDTKGNTSDPVLTTLQIDGTSPLTQASIVDSYTAAATVTLTAEDAVSGVESTMWRIDEGEWQNGTVANLPAEPGDHTFEWYSTDAAGNTETTHSVSYIMYDRVEQTNALLEFRGAWFDVANTALSGGSMNKVQTSPASVFVNFHGTAVSWVALKSPRYGIAKITLDGGTPEYVDLYDPNTSGVFNTRVWTRTGLANTTHTLSIEWTGQKNAAATASEFNFDALDIAGEIVSDVVAPVTTSSATGAWRPNSETVTLSSIDAHTWVSLTKYRINGSAPITYTVPFAVTMSGENTIEYYSVDSVGNVEATKTCYVRIDRGLPTVTDDAPLVWGRGPVTVRLTGSDTQSGLNYVLYSTDGGSPALVYSTPISISAEGTTNIRYRAVDVVGNSSTIKTAAVRIDNTAPVSSSNAPTAWIGGPTAVTLTATDAHSGAGVISYSLDGVEMAPYTGPVAVAGAGTHVLAYRAVDVAGNVEATKTATVRIDQAAPLTSASVASSYYATGTVALVATDSAASGVATTQWRIDGGAWQSGTSATLPYVSGYHRLEWRSTDVVGNVEEVKGADYVMYNRAEHTDSRLTFKGAWYSVGNGSLSAGSMNKVVTSPAYAYATFRGTAVDWLATKSPRYGIAKITLDGGAPQYVDLYDANAAGVFQARVWSVSGLEDTTHTVAIEWTGQKNDAAVANEFNFDALDIVGTFLSDTVAPATASSASGAWRPNSETVTLSASDANSYVAITKYRVNGGSLTTYTVPFSVTLEGENNIEYFSVDGAGNSETPKQCFVRIDRTAPSASDNAQSAWTHGPVAVTLNATDAGSGIDLVSYSTDGSVPSLPYTDTLAITAEGTTTVRYRVSDKVGNTGSFLSVPVRIDNSAPALVDNAPTDWVDGPLSVTLGASDTLSGVTRIAYSLDGSDEATYTGPVAIDDEGIHHLTYTAYDKAGNAEPIKDLEIKVDRTAPQSSDNAPTGWVDGPVLVTLSSEDNVSGVASLLYSLDGTDPSVPYTEPLLISEQGETTLRYAATDVKGNAEEPTTRVISIDNLAPSTTDDVVVGWVKDPATVTLTAEDAVSGVNLTEYRIDEGEWLTYSAPFVLDSDGERTIQYRSTDVKGNVEDVHSVTSQIDLTAPVTLSSAVATSYSKSATITLSPSDGLSGIASTSWRIDGGAWQTGTVAVLPHQPGSHTLQWFSTDVAGNAETLNSATYAMYGRIEATDSRIHFKGSWYQVNATDASAGNLKKVTSGPASAYVTFRGTAIDLVMLKSFRYGIAKVTLDGGTPAYVDLYDPSTTGVFQQKVWTAQDLTDATHTVVVDYTGTKNASASYAELNFDAIDVAGVLIADNIAPVTTTSATGAWRSTSETVTLTATDANSYVMTTKYRVNGGALTTYTAPFAVTPEGDSGLEFYSIDALGNTEAIKTARVRIDKTAPTASDDAPASWTKSLDVHITGTDAASGIAGAYYSTDGSAPSLAYGSAISLSAEGTTTLKYKTVDAAGNSSAIKTVSVRIDNSVPTASDNMPAGGWMNGTGSVVLSGSDALSGLKGIRYSIDGSDYATYTAPFQLAEGQRTVAYFAIDNAGNAAELKSATVNVDLNAPSTTGSVAASYSAAATITLSPSDAGSGVSSTSWKLDSGAWNSGTTVVLPNVGGRHTLYWRSTDVAGNTEATQSATYNMYQRTEHTDSRLYFKGGWYRIDNAKLSASSMNKVITPNSGAYIKFKGTAIDIIALKSPRYSIAKVTVDDGAPEYVDLYSADPNGVWNTKVWSAAGLSDTTHTVAFEYTGQTNPGAVAAEFNFDAVDVAGTLLDFSNTVEDTDSRLYFDPSWFEIANSSLSDGTMKKTIAAGSANLTFRGTAVEWNALKSPRYGVAFVSIDGTGTTAVDLYDANPAGSWKQRVWSATGLADTTHTVTVSWTGNKNPDATANEVNVDSFNVRGLVLQHKGRMEQNEGRIWFGSDWFNVNSVNLSGGSMAKVTEADSPAFVSFKGTEIDLIGLKTASYGIARITLDNNAPEMVDLYAPTDQWKSKMWSAQGLTDTTHTVQVEWTGTKNPASSGYSVGLDAVDLVGTLVTAVPNKPVYTRFEQTDSRAVFTPSWFNVNSFNVSGGSLKKTSTAGDRAFVSFKGTAFKWVGVKTPSYGIARVTLDGGAPQLIDLYSPTDQWKAKLFTASGLSDTTHTVTIEWTGDRNPSSSGTAIAVDAFDVIGTLTQASASGAPLARFEQTDARLLWSGSWKSAASQYMSGSSSKKLSSAGSLTVNFTGTEVAWITLKTTTYGIARVTLDGGTPQDVDLYAPGDQWQSKVWSAEGLTDGPHTLTIEYTGTKNAASAGTSILVDAFDIRGSLN